MDTSKMTPEELERYNYRMSVCHSGPCSSPYRNNCPCSNDCPLHGRCCDCVHHHLDSTIRSGEISGFVKERMLWMTACQRCAQQGKFDEVYIHEAEK